MIIRLLVFLCLVASLSAAPTVSVTSPAPGSTVSSLTSVSITFSEAVAGVDANDLQINNDGATGVSGSGAGPYIFTFTQPPPGTVSLSWDIDHGIAGLGTGAFAPTGGWIYTLSDILAPTVAKVTTSVAGQEQDSVVPLGGSTLATLTEVQVTFNEPVVGVDATDLLVGGVAATAVTGSDAGPYTFTCAQPPVGPVTIGFAVGHGIQDLAGNGFAGLTWNVTCASSAGTVAINEILVANASVGPVDEDNEFSEWIELYNPGASAVNLLGWSLTNDPEHPNQWVFPSRTLNAGAYLLVYASGKDRKPASGNLHTNFQLNANGDSIYLFPPNSPRAATSSLVDFPPQRYNYSYGPQVGGQLRYFSTPTPPGSPNPSNGLSQLTAIGAAPTASVSRGFFNEPFNVILSTTQAGATIRYTLDGSVPLATSAQYTTPINVATTTVLRAATFSSSTVPSDTVTHSYFFLDHVLNQPSPPYDNPSNATDDTNPKLPTVSSIPLASGGVQFPVTWGSSLGGTASLITNIPANSVPADYGMDPEIINDPNKYDDTGAINNATGKLNIDRIKQGFRDLPMLSIVLKNDDFFGASGLYPNSTQKGTAYEKACSVELLMPDGTTGFASTCGLRIHGNASRSPANCPKHGFKLNFKGSFGASTLGYALFPDSPVEEFDDLILRADYNSSWVHHDGGVQRPKGTRLRDAFCKDTFRAMGRVAGHHRYVNLFINGIYWGTYDPTEQENNGFAAAYFGGGKDDYVIYEQSNTPKSGVDTIMSGDTITPWARISGDGTGTGGTLPNATTSAIYENYKRYLDVPFFIDYMLLHFWVGHQDWGGDPLKNWYCARNSKTGGTFKFFPWDMENLMWAETQDSTTVSLPPGRIHTKLVVNPQYQLDFADQAYKHMVAVDGALQPSASIARWNKWQAIMTNAIACESARWGDYRRDVHPNAAAGPFPLYTWHSTFITETNRLKTVWFPRRITNTTSATQGVLPQLRSRGLYPMLNAPEFRDNTNNLQIGSQRVTAGFQVKLQFPTTTAFNQSGTAATSAGTFYYTTDGSDPRVYYDTTGTRTPTAVAYSTPIVISSTTTIKARTLNGTTWSALAEATFTVGNLQPAIRITEIHYNPPVGQGGQAAVFIEIQNTGNTRVDLSNWFFDGVELIIPYGTIIDPGARLVFANNNAPAVFAAQFPGVAVTSYFGGSLNNAGESIALNDATGRRITSVDYKSVAPWPTTPNGGGFSLEVINPDGDPNSPFNWKASNAVKGTPGAANSTGTTPTVTISEFLVKNAGGYTFEGATPGYVELFNSGGTPADIGNWQLVTPEGGTFVIPGGTSIPGTSYALIHFTPAAVSGLKISATLNEREGRIYLRNSSGAVVDGVQYGPQVANFSFARSGGSWVLATPTAGAANTPAATGSPSALRLNEWMANPTPGFDDWIELANSSAQPVVLTGTYVSTSTELYRIVAPSAVAGTGFVQLYCNRGGNKGNNLDFNLPASGATLTLWDSNAATVNTVTFGTQTENVSQGRLPDLTGSPTTLVYPSPGVPNHAAIANAPSLNEVLVTNLNGDNAPWATRPGWVELKNSTPGPISLAGWSLRIPTNPDASWTFPAGATVPAAGYLAIWADPSQPASTVNGLHLNYALPGNIPALGSNGVELVNPLGQIADRITWGKQITDLSIGRLGNNSWALLASPTRGSANQGAATLGPVSAVKINEWYAMGTGLNSDFDYIELYNTSPLPVALGGLFLADEPSEMGRRKYQFPPLTFIAGSGFVAMTADGTASANFTGFSLDGGGEYLRLALNDNSLVEAFGFGQQTLGTAQGRQPEGSTTTGTFPATPGAPNSSGTGPTITRHPSSVVAPGGSTVGLSITASGATSYQWKRNGQDVPGATAASLSLSPLQLAQDGTYTCVATGAGGSTTSLPATVTVLFTYDMWADSYGLVGAARAGTADAEKDGLTNYEEFLANTHPLTTATPTEISTVHPVPGLEFSGGSPSFLTLDVRLNRRAAFSEWSGEISSNLPSGWTPAAPSSTQLLGTEPNGDQRLRLKFAVPNGTAQRFLRLTLTP